MPFFGVFWAKILKISQDLLYIYTIHLCSLKPYTTIYNKYIQWIICIYIIYWYPIYLKTICWFLEEKVSILLCYILVINLKIYAELLTKYTIWRRWDFFVSREEYLYNYHEILSIFIKHFVVKNFFEWFLV